MVLAGAFALLFSVASAAGEIQSLDVLRQNVCQFEPSAKTCSLRQKESLHRREAFESLCRTQFPDEKMELAQCQKMKTAAFAKIDSEHSPESIAKERQLIENRFMSCSMDQACLYEKAKAHSFPCASGVIQGLEGFVMSVVEMPRKIVESLSLNADRNCFENKDGSKENLITIFNLNIPDKFKEFRISEEIKTAAIKNWRCSDIREYLLAKKRAYQAHIGPLVAQGLVKPGDADSPLLQIMNQLYQGLQKKWICYTPEAKIEMACSLLSSTVASSALGMGFKALVSKLTLYGLTELEIGELFAARKVIDDFPAGGYATTTTDTVVKQTSIAAPLVAAATTTDVVVSEITAKTSSKAVSPPGDIPALKTKAQRRTYKRFDPNHSEEFQNRLKEFRGTSDQSFDPAMHGREGQIFTSAKSPNLALKRFFSDNKDLRPWDGVRYLEEAREKVEAQPALHQHLSVVKVHEKGSDWILREFDPLSVPAKDLMGTAEVREAVQSLIKSMKYTKDPILLKILNKLDRNPLSENLHWSPSKKKILLIDITQQERPRSSPIYFSLPA